MGSQATERFIPVPVLIKHMGQESCRLAEERFDVYKINRIFFREMGL